MSGRRAGKTTRMRAAFDLVGGLPLKRLRFVYMDPKDGLTAVAWEASGEVRTIPAGEYTKLEDE
jgi:hypothetical protein